VRSNPKPGPAERLWSFSFSAKLLLFSLLLVSTAAVDPSIAETKSERCTGYAHQAAQATPTTTGVARGAARGAVIGAVTGNAGAGAATGAVVGTVRKQQQQHHSFQYYYDKCMSR